MKENKDYILEGGFSIAYRRRPISVNKYGEISIRHSRANGTKTERQKILDGECQVSLFIWEFQDAWVVCTLGDILKCLKADKGYAQPNNDHVTAAYYIKLRDINHSLIRK